MKRLQRQLQQGWGVGQAEGCQMRGWGGGGIPRLPQAFARKRTEGRGEESLD